MHTEEKRRITIKTGYKQSTRKLPSKSKNQDEIETLHLGNIADRKVLLLSKFFIVYVNVCMGSFLFSYIRIKRCHIANEKQKKNKKKTTNENSLKINSEQELPEQKNGPCIQTNTQNRNETKRIESQPIESNPESIYF